MVDVEITGPDIEKLSARRTSLAARGLMSTAQVFPAPPRPSNPESGSFQVDQAADHRTAAV
jgi:hypothetical protein